MNSRGTWAPFMAFLRQTRRFSFFDLLIIAGLAGLVLGLADLAKVATAPSNVTVDIDLDDPWSLPRLTFFSLTRGLLAYGLSLLFTLSYGYWAAKDHVAERVLVPLLDILQSLPVLSFLPGVVLVLVACFPTSNLGLELAAVLMIFTGQAWNMTFSYYHAIKGVPQDMREVASIFRMTSWQRWRWLELPYATMGLVWNSMMSMAGGWFFLMVCETFTLGEGQDFRLAGIGSYMSIAVDQGRGWCMVQAVFAMTVMIVGLDQLLWRPVVVWAQKYRVEEGGQQDNASSWFLDWLRRSRLVQAVTDWLRALRSSPLDAGLTGSMVQPFPPMEGLPTSGPQPSSSGSVSSGPDTAGKVSPPLTPGLASVTSVSPAGPSAATLTPKEAALASKPLLGMAPGAGRASHWAGTLSLVAFLVLVGLLGLGAWSLLNLVWNVSALQWGETWLAAAVTLGRVLASTALGTLWAVPAGLAIGLSPRLSRALQPLIQVLASFPAPMLFPLVIAVLALLGVPLNWGSILLMLLGTQWYILFNVVAGAMAIPADLREMARSYHLSLLRRFRTLYLPAVFPFLVTGWVTAAGGAWNASIVSEYVKYKGEVLQAEGLGARISLASNQADYPLLAAGTVVMALVVVIFNRTVWRACYRLAETRYSLNK